jgi:hypothetical protein
MARQPAPRVGRWKDCGCGSGGSVEGGAPRADAQGSRSLAAAEAGRGAGEGDRKAVFPTPAGALWTYAMLAEYSAMLGSNPLWHA